MNQKLEVIQKQKQQFSPKLIHSMNMLQMGYHEMETLIDTSLLDNPFSDVDDHLISATNLVEKDVDYKKSRKHNNDLQEFDIADTNEVDLLSHVKMQLEKYIKTATDLQAITFLVESLDAKGYLNEEMSVVCNLFDLTDKEGMYYLKLLQSVEPKGLGARDLIECLLLQLDNNKSNSLAKLIIESYLEYVGIKNYSYIAKAENVSIEEVKTAVSLIKEMNPLPANGFAIHERTTYIIPDAYIESEEDEIVIELNSGFEKKLKINENNLELYKQAKLDKDSKEFLSKKLQDFKWLQYCTTRRSITLKKIITALVDYQDVFFKTGEKRNLKPLRLIDIEEMTGLHSSTISRALQDKYFKCNFGTYPLRTLVPRTYSKRGSVSAPRNLIKEEIQEIIRLEDKQHPYSDQQIQVILKEEGFPVSRRSVSKYREELSIPSSNVRRE